MLTAIIIIGLVVLFTTISDKITHEPTPSEVDAMIGATQSAYRNYTKDMK